MDNLNDQALEGLRNISAIKHQLTMAHPDPTAPSFQLALFLYMMPATGHLMLAEDAKEVVFAHLEKTVDEFDQCRQWAGSVSSLIKGATINLSGFIQDVAKHDRGKTIPLNEYIEWSHLITVIEDRVQLGAQLAYPERIIFQSENILLVASSENPEDQGLVGEPEPLLAAKPEGTNLWNYYADGFMDNKRPSEEEYQACREAVARYQGSAIGGPCTSKKAERFCEACGLKVVKGVAYLGNPEEARHRPKAIAKSFTYSALKGESLKLQAKADKCRSKKAPRPKPHGFQKDPAPKKAKRSWINEYRYGLWDI